MAQLRDSVFLESAPRIDSERGILFGVKLLGRLSRNNREYAREAMESAAPRYSGLKVYVDHPVNGNAERSVDRWAGTIQNARFEEDGIYGDIKLRTKSPFFEGIVEAARDFPKDVGFSHVAEGSTRMEGETEIVESIKEVFSVDLVTDPATTRGIFESRRTKPATLKTAIESLPEGPVRKRLVEMMGGGYIDGGMSFEAESEPADPLAQMSSLCKELIAMLGETLKALATKKDTPPADPATPPIDTPVVEEPEDEMKPEDEKKQAEQQLAFESVKKENAELKAKALLLESGREASDIRVKALASAAEDDREALLESWPLQEASERPLSSPPLIESAGAFDFDKPGSFSARYR